ncbi:CGNR zinc finger domain-containing protein [Crossiella sp. SN42]|uniref:CGNR zinc finger domain-containing protein n=1 Tax=Crossiella sp. SN42 TaxID=2944808 RepID=UPI00207C9572|nr:CGNR zinc finger domain-containing protein [Crossiella sp. SN42]MCO1576624.1 CGNR zinc finger domain-containing protein [Crossiella sp. SN42]
MDNADYLDVALRLANASLDNLTDLRAALHDEPWWADRTTEADLDALRTVATALRQALAAAVDNDPDAVLSRVNTLLAAHPPRPRLSGHGDGEEVPNWHIHVAEPDAPPAQEVAAAAAWGLAQAVVRHGLDRWGHCAAEDCATYFVDTSTNRAKRFCSARCANRVHVAAFRARQRT